MGIITVSLGFYELQTKKAQGSTLQAIKMLHKPKSDRDLIHSVTHIVGLGGSAVSRANKKISIVMTIINEQSLSASPPTSDLGNLGCCNDTWKLPAPMIQLQRINHFLMPKPFPFSISLGTVYNHPASQGSLLLRGGGNNACTTTEKMLFRVRGLLFKTVHQGYFPPRDLWAL